MAIASNGEGSGTWSDEEHARFLEAIALYPKGPWKDVAAYIGTRNTRQTMTHAQKYRQKLARRSKGLRLRKQQMEDKRKTVEECSSPLRNHPSAPSDRKHSSPSKTEEVPEANETNAAIDTMDETRASITSSESAQDLDLVEQHALVDADDDDDELQWIDDCLDYIVRTFYTKVEEDQ